MNQDFSSLIRKFRAHFINNPEKLYSVRFFEKKYQIKYARAYSILERLRTQGHVRRFYLSAWQSCFAWGVPHPIFSLYVLQDTNISRRNRIS